MALRHGIAITLHADLVQASIPTFQQKIEIKKKSSQSFYQIRADLVHNISRLGQKIQTLHVIPKAITRIATIVIISDSLDSLYLIERAWLLQKSVAVIKQH